MEILFEIWLRVFELYAGELFFQESSSGVFSFMVIGLLAYLYKQEKKDKEKKCSCCQKEGEKQQTDESL